MTRVLQISETTLATLIRAARCARVDLTLAYERDDEREQYSALALLDAAIFSAEDTLGRELPNAFLDEFTRDEPSYAERHEREPQRMGEENRGDDD